MKKKIFIPVLIFVIVSAIICTCITINWAHNMAKAKEQQSEINKATVETVAPSDFFDTRDYETTTPTEKPFEPSYIIDFENLKETNSDTVAWIKIENTEIEYPIVQTEDNSYYLEHDFNKTENIAGWIFADWANDMKNLDLNTVLYGHNQRDGSMFANVNRLLHNINEDNCGDYKVTFVTPNHYYEGYIFSIYEVDPDADYRTANPENIQTFAEDANTASWNALSLPDFDHILTLSTCADIGENRTACHIALTQLN